MTAIDTLELRKAGAEALRRGDARAARDSFERLVDAGQADINVHLALAGACARLNDLPAAQGSVDRALALDARNLRALILKADLLAAQGDPRAASSFYMAAAQNAPPPNELTADLRGDVERAHAMCRR